jgi:SAM-dependent methyltransferase
MTGRLDWGRVSDEYARYRAGPPASFYQRLKAHGVGVPGQRLLDVGTGTGLLARNFARAGARVWGVDTSPEQIERAKESAARDGLSIDFRVAAAEATPFEPGSFDALTANQCWHYFDNAKALAEARRVLAPGGLLAVSDFFWVASIDPVAGATDDLILKHNPGWVGYRWNGRLPVAPDAPVAAVIDYEEPIPFTQETWRGRIRTCRAIGPSLSSEAVAAFDDELATYLRARVPERFDVLHKVIAHIYRLG